MALGKTLADPFSRDSPLPFPEVFHFLDKIQNEMNILAIAL